MKSPPLGSPSAHKAQRDVHAARLLRSNATSTLGSHSLREEACSGEKTFAFSRREHRAHLDLSSYANRHVHATTLLRSHAVRTVGSLPVRKETCPGETAAAFPRREHSWISPRAQRDMSQRNSCCVLTSGAQLDLSPCANRHVHATMRQHCCARTL